MITKTIQTDLGSYDQKVNHGYIVHSIHHCIGAFKTPENLDEWSNCPCCNLKPKVWLYDNGMQTACGCFNSMYDHFAVHTESVMSVYRRCDGNLSEYNRDNLRLNWNEYCATMVNPCNHSDLRDEGKW